MMSRVVRVLALFALFGGLRPPSAESTPPLITGPVFLPGDVTPAASASQEELPAIARGGDQFLAVWADSRTNFFSLPPFVEDQGARDIYAARLDAAGHAIDGAPIAVSQDFGWQKNPQVAWNGENWLVVWENQSPTTYYYASGVRAARVAPDGTVLDTTPIVVKDFTSSSSLMFALTSNGSDWCVALQGTSVGEVGILGLRVGAAGNIIDPAPVTLVPGLTSLYFNLGLASAGGEYLLNYDTQGTTEARRFTSALTPIGAPFGLPGSIVRSNGSGYFVTWASANGLLGSPLSVAGTLSIPAGAVLGPSSGVSERDLSWDGTNWWFSWLHGTNGIQMTRISAAGVALDPKAVVLTGVPAGTLQKHRVAGVTGGGAVVVWQDWRVGGALPNDIRSAAYNAAVVPGADTPISLAEPTQLASDMAPGSDGFLLTYASLVSGATRIKAERLDAAGLPIESEPVTLATGPSLGAPRVAWNGSVYLVTWVEGGIVRGKRVNPDGTVVDATALSIMPGYTSDLAALNGVFLVTTTYYTYSPQYVLPFSMRVDGATGANLDAGPVLLGQYYARYPRVIACGNRWLAVWQRNYSHDNVQAEMSGCFIDAGGVPTPEFRTTMALAGRFAPDVAFSGNVAMIVYRTGSESNANADIWAFRLNPDGSLPNGTTGILVSAAPGKQQRPAITWDGTEFLTAWDDKRNQLAFFDDRTDIYGARLSEDGAVLDPDGFPIATSPRPETQASLASAGGTTLIAASLLRSGAPHGSYRIGIFDPSSVSAVDEGTGRPPAFVLGANTPNPFRAVTVLSFRLEVGGWADLAVFDAAGRRVRRLVGAELPAGPHTVVWNGRDDAGRAASAGVYFYRLQAGGAAQSRALRLVK